MAQKCYVLPEKLATGSRAAAECFGNTYTDGLIIFKPVGCRRNLLWP